MRDFKALDRIAASQYGVLTTKNLKKAGFSRHQVSRCVREGSLRRVHLGVWALVGAYDAWVQAVSAAALAAAEPLGGASVRSAARLFGLRTVDSEVEVSIRYPRQLELEGVKVHRSRDLIEDDLTYVDGIPTTTPERTICDLGLVFPDHEVLRILRHAVATGMVNRTEVQRIRDRVGKQGRDGAGVTRRCLDQLADDAERTESGIEALFLELCERFGLPAPAIQLPVWVRGRCYRLDFAYPSRRIFIEIDGISTHRGLEPIADDDLRQNMLVAAGWRPLRFTYQQLCADPARCAEAISAMLDL